MNKKILIVLVLMAAVIMSGCTIDGVMSQEERGEINLQRVTELYEMGSPLESINITKGDRNLMDLNKGTYVMELSDCIGGSISPVSGWTYHDDGWSNVYAAYCKYYIIPDDDEERLLLTHSDLDVDFSLKCLINGGLGHITYFVLFLHEDTFNEIKIKEAIPYYGTAVTDCDESYYQAV